MGGVYSQPDQVRMLIGRFDRVIQLLETLNQSILAIDVQPQPQIQPEPPMQQPPALGEIRRLLEVLVAASLPSSPAVTRSITVATTETLIIANEADVLLPIEITNDDIAQDLYLSGPGVIRAEGRKLQPEQTIRYVMPIDTMIYGVVDVATIEVRVSEGFNIFSRMETLEG